MAKQKWLPATLSTAIAVTAALASYAGKASTNDEPKFLVQFATGHRSWIASLLLILSLISAVVEWARAALLSRQDDRDTLQRLLNDFSGKEFPEKGRKNRISLLKKADGWTTIWFVANRLSVLAGRARWRAALRIRPHYTYLLVFLRSVDARGQKSATVLRVADQLQHCDGMAGKVWEEGFTFEGELPRITAEMVQRMSSLSALDPTDPVAQYARTTHMTDLVLLRSMGNFARHFMGSVIKRHDGSIWGILLLDSEDDSCPFQTQTGGKFADRFKDLARTLGRVVR